MKIVVRGTNWIGDAVMSVPALRELRRLFPDAHIALHTRSWAEGIFRDADFLDEIIAIEKKSSDLSTVLGQVRTLDKRKFDLAVIFPNSYRSAAIAKLARVPRRFGYAKEGRRLLLTDPIRVPKWKNERHESYYYLSLIAEVANRVLGPSAKISDDASPLIDLSEKRRQNGSERLRAAGCADGRPTIAMGVGSTNSMAKRWPASNFAVLADMLIDNGFDVVLMGSPEERGVSADLSALAKGKLIDLTGTTSLAEAVEILGAVDLFISNDMGLAHVAAAVGTPTLAIFGPTNPLTTRPLPETAEIIREPVECSPCMLRECPIDHRCMTRISPQRVFESAVRLLS